MGNDAPGLYEELIDLALSEELSGLHAQRLVADIHDVDPAELPGRVAALTESWVRQSLAAVPAEARVEAAIRLTAAIGASTGEQAVLAAPIQSLAAIEHIGPTGEPITIRRPLTPMGDTVLMTNARDQPAIGREIEAEIESADRIDLVLAFIRWTGIRDLLPHLRRHVAAGKTLRIITTTYTGSTELRALEALVDLGANVKVSYDTTTTRLHAKAWLFDRPNRLSTVFIGSSNLTFSAQVTGLEWNVRASQRVNPELIATFDRTFATYWADPHFEDFDPQRFAQATAASDAGDSILTPFQIEPYPFQRQILERLQVDRRRGHPHNLVAAATGTGKTIIAALDYRHLQSELTQARLLFVAHRTEILEQSRTTFRHVLRDGTFGEMWVGGQRPTQWDHVFASIQSIHANDAASLDPEQFDVVIVDEFHHSAAASYDALLSHLRPKHLLGLTATPERTDGLDVLRWFGNRISVELRLWDALEQGLLSPFHYYGVHDATDLRNVTWRRGKGYDAGELADIYMADDLWASKVMTALAEKVGDPARMKALGFCVNIDHAEFMAARFTQAGIRAEAVTSRTSAENRKQALANLQAGRTQILLTVDLFNEGVDIPAIDVVLMLRLTESATIFLQQLGRGLRRSAGKDVLTVLDFVGHQRKEFRFDLRYRHMLGRTRRELETDVQQGFPYLPAGCSLELDRVAQEIVLRNLREALPTTWKQRVQELRSLGDPSLPTYLDETGLELADIYRGGHTWTSIRRAAGLGSVPALDGEERAGRGIARLIHVDDQDRIDTYRDLLSGERPPKAADLDVQATRQLEGLLLTTLNPKKSTYSNLEEAAGDLWRHQGLREELLEVLPLLETQVTHLNEPLGLGYPVPLQVHASYTREEILAAFGASTVTKPLPLQTGVHWHEPTQTHLLFITLQKAEKDYSPTTRYLDYAISDSLFHWESQAKDRELGALGQNYIHHEARGRNIALFIRTAKKDPTGRTLPYFCAGTASYVSHQSERPMQITWQLHHPLPGDLFTAYRAAVA